MHSVEKKYNTERKGNRIKSTTEGKLLITAKEKEKR